MRILFLPERIFGKVYERLPFLSNSKFRLCVPGSAGKPSQQVILHFSWPLLSLVRHVLRPANSECFLAPKHLREDILDLADAICRRGGREILACLWQFRAFAISILRRAWR